jgi:hypothetical protein
VRTLLRRVEREKKWGKGVVLLGGGQDLLKVMATKAITQETTVTGALATSRIEGAQGRKTG